MKSLSTAPCIYFGGDVIIICYVDDILILAKEEERINNIKKQLSNNLVLKDLGKPVEFLGIQFKRTEHGSIKMRQPNLIEKLIKYNNMQNSKPMSSPAATDVNLNDNIGNRLSKDMHHRYRSTVGSLLYIATKTRPDISVITSMLGMHVEEPADKHWTAIKRVLRYLNGTLNKYYMLKPEKYNEELVAYVDANWASDADNKRRSRTGIVIYYAGAPIYCTCTTQKTISLRSTEAEYIALAEGGRIITWLRQVMDELDIKQGTIKIYQDNNGTIEWANAGNAKHFTRRKHIDIKYNFINRMAEEKLIELVKINTYEMKSDFLTKILPPNEYIIAIKISNIFTDVDELDN